MSGGIGGRQSCGLRSTVALNITSAWRLSEPKTTAISFAFPLAGIKERAAAVCPLADYLHNCARWTVFHFMWLS